MQKSQGFTQGIQQFVLASEGGYVDHPKDPGGATNMGITFKTLQAYRGKPITKEDVRNLSKQEALDIYKAQYWDAARCSTVPLGIDYMLMDYTVNSGASRAIKDLQRTVGVEPDGVIGKFTTDAIQKFVDTKGLTVLLIAYADARWEFMQDLSTFSTFGKGWQRRVWGNTMGAQANDIGVVDRATKLAAGVAPENIAMPAMSVGLAQPEKPSNLDLLKDPATLTGAAGAAATVFGAIQSQPILQIAALVAIAAVVFMYLKKRREESPT